MAEAPYSTGDRLPAATGDGTRTVVVSSVVALKAINPRRRWRLLCRDVDGSPIDVPLYCGDDGSGDRVWRPRGDGRPSCPQDVRYLTACALGLTFSGLDPADAVEYLLAAANQRFDLVDAARTALYSDPVEDPDLISGARELVVDAAHQCRTRRGVRA
jgi:hypothetical protein